MKNSLSIILGLLLTISLIACSKDQTAISYNEHGNYGVNLLYADSVDSLLPNSAYSLSADLEKNATLLVEFVNLTDPTSSIVSIWSYDGSTNDGWIISDYSFQYNTQTFESKEGGNLDLRMDFPGTGSCQMNIYENGGTLTDSKYISW